MPELPDITAYVGALTRVLVGQRILAITVVTPFVLRTVTPPPSAVEGQVITAVDRIGKRLVLHGENHHALVIHLMVAGRFRWLAPNAKPPGRISLLVLRTSVGSLVLTEASRKRRASLHVVQGANALAAFDRGGLDILTSDAQAFAVRARLRNHTFKRALTDPTIFDGVGNAYSDEILHAAQLSPFRQTQAATDDELARLWRAAQDVLTTWIARLGDEAARAFPTAVTAFRPEMAVHGKYGQPCPRCAAPVQRIVYAENEANYCARCQTDGRLLADRSLSRLLHADWPKTLAALEERTQAQGVTGGTKPSR